MPRIREFTVAYSPHPGFPTRDTVEHVNELVYRVTRSRTQDQHAGRLLMEGLPRRPQAPITRCSRALASTGAVTWLLPWYRLQAERRPKLLQPLILFACTNANNRCLRTRYLARISRLQAVLANVTAVHASPALQLHLFSVPLDYW